MPVRFGDADTDPSGTAGYLKFVPRAAKDTWLGALFIMSARGEPVEFAHARVRSPNPLLWRATDLDARCMESLFRAMLQACPVVPNLILCLADETGRGAFCRRVHLDVPIGCVVPGGQGQGAAEWITQPPLDSPPQRLLECLSARGLLLEPFERAEAGLREVYSGLLS